MRIAKRFFYISSLMIGFCSMGLAQKNRLNDFNKGVAAWQQLILLTDRYNAKNGMDY
jgi:hypothetical protein